MSQAPRKPSAPQEGLPSGLSLQDPSLLRRGQILSWEWGSSGIGPDCREAGIRPIGRLVTIADYPSLRNPIGLLVEDGPKFVLNPISAIRSGKRFTLVQDAPVPAVLNAHRVGRNPGQSIYVGRPSPYGNPFTIGEDGSREEVLCKYLHWLEDNPDFVDAVRRDLAGRDLVCWCAPASCHGHILRDIALGHPVPEPAPPRQASLSL